MSRVNSISGKVGRRPGSSDTKPEIILAAQSLFAAKGYDRTSMREIATMAGVDAAMIVHYFATKQQLFVQSMLPLFEGPKLLPTALEGDKDDIGIRLAQFFIAMTNNTGTKKLMLGIFRSASSEEQAASFIRKFAEGTMMLIVEGYLPGPNKKLQANIIGSQLIGLFILKYIVCVEPLASATDDELIKYLAPRLQSHF